MAGYIYYARHSRNHRIVGIAPESTIVPALENDIKAWNDNPSPFTWTKTADEILSSRYSPSPLLRDSIGEVLPEPGPQAAGRIAARQARRLASIM
jgi:hypothetical protein